MLDGGSKTGRGAVEMALLPFALAAAVGRGLHIFLVAASMARSGAGMPDIHAKSGHERSSIHGPGT